MVHKLLLDFGNVLGYFRHRTACERLAELCTWPETANSIYLALFEPSNVTRRQRGWCTGSDLLGDMIDFYHLPSSVQLPEFSKVWGDIFTPAPPEIEYILDRLRPDVVAAIASNTEVLHWPFIERLPTVQRFIGVPNRDVVCSFDVGFEKPDVQFFEKALERIGATRPDEVLFIDDVPENVRAFQLMGGKGCVFDLTKNAPRELEDILALHNLLTV